VSTIWIPYTRIERLNRASLGLAIILSGFPIAWVARAALGSVDSKIPILITFCTGLAFLVGWSNVAKLRFYGNWRTVAPVLFLALACALSLFGAETADTVWAELLVVLAVLFAIHTRPLHAFEPLPASLVIVGSLSLAVTFVYAWAGINPSFGGTEEIGARLFAGDSNNPNYVSFVAGLVILAANTILWRDQSIATVNVVLVISAMLLGMAAIILAGTRSAFVGLFACLAIFFGAYIRRRTRYTRRPIRRVSGRETHGKMLGLLIGLAAVVLIPSQIRHYVVSAGENLLTTFELGLQAYVYGHASGEISAETRRDLLEYTLANINISGHGYKALYVDFPILQAFFDLGLAGGLLFLVVAVLIPTVSAIWLVAMRNCAAPMRFVGYIYVFFLPNLFFHGEPYDYSIWLPIVTYYAVALRSATVSARWH
jgi:hypothetical protein